MSTQFDLAVVGAGLAGSYLASAMAARGWRVLLLEKDRLPRHKVCGEFLSPEAQETLQAAGLRQTVAALDPVPLDRGLLISRRGTEMAVTLPGSAWGISRHALDHALAHAAVARGATLHEQSAVTALEPGDAVTTIHARSESFRARAVILASGRNTATKLLTHSRSQARERAAADFIGIKAHFCDVAMPPRVELFLFDGGYVGINPVEGGVANVSLLASYAAFARAGRKPLAMIKAIRRQNVAFDARLSRAALVADSLCTVGSVNTHRPAQPWTNVACVGDVVSMIPPLCGDGMAMALRSAELCAPFADNFLRGDLSLAAWETGYTSAWRREFAGRLRVGRLAQTVLNREWGAEALLRAGQWMPRVADRAVVMTRGSVAERAPYPAASR